jgi:hypothetical protein
VRRLAWLGSTAPVVTVDRVDDGGGERSERDRREGDIFRKVVGWSVLFLVVMSPLVFLQTNVLEWMLP